MIKIDFNVALKLHKLLTDFTGGSNEIRDYSLLDSALNAAFQTFKGKELYPSLEEKGARLGFNLVSNHAFIDGNKRTSVIYSNHYLISRGKGIIVIPAELTNEFKDLLILYYEGKDTKKIKEFIKEKCYMEI